MGIPIPKNNRYNVCTLARFSLHKDRVYSGLRVDFMPLHCGSRLDSPVLRLGKHKRLDQPRAPLPLVFEARRPPVCEQGAHWLQGQEVRKYGYKHLLEGPLLPLLV